MAIANDALFVSETKKRACPHALFFISQNDFYFTGQMLQRPVMSLR